jgi:tetratricopeptide (TPR) repeat protein
MSVHPLAPPSERTGKLALPELAALKARGRPIVMVTAYDAPGGRLADEAGVELVLVGDSAAMTVLGHDSTVPATMDEMLVLTRAVTRASLRPLVVRSQTYDFLRRARAAREAERLGEAVALYREAVESNGGYFAPANLELGYSLAGLRRGEEAISSLLLVIERSGTRYPVAFYHLGRLYEHAGQLAPAGESFARAAELMGEEAPQVYTDLSRVREKEGKAAEALAAMESYVRAMSRLGDVPDWAQARLAKLKAGARD